MSRLLAAALLAFSAAAAAAGKPAEREEEERKEREEQERRREREEHERGEREWREKTEFGKAHPGDDEALYAMGAILGSRVAGYGLSPKELKKIERGFADAAAGKKLKLRDPDLDEWGAKVESMLQRRGSTLTPNSAQVSTASTFTSCTLVHRTKALCRSCSLTGGQDRSSSSWRSSGPSPTPAPDERIGLSADR